jgi:hypothetical protein
VTPTSWLARRPAGNPAPRDLIAAETLEEASPDVVVNFRSEDLGTIDTE